MSKIHKNKLSVYLIKKEVTKPSEILRDFENLKREQIDRIGTLYYGESHAFEPAWIKKFFINTINNEDDEGKWKIFNASSKAVFLVKASKRQFAITFGYGYTLLKEGVYEERFGLKVALNIIDAQQMRAIDKKTLSTTFKRSREQIAKVGTVADFGIDIEQDLLQGITGVSLDEKFGKTVTGKEALSISVPVNIKNIKKFLSLCYQKYKRDDYKENFEWVDHITELNNPSIVEKLNNALIEKLATNNTEKIWMAVPEIIDWHNVQEFRYGGKSERRHKSDDIYLDDFLNSLSDTERDEMSLELLKRKNIYCIGASSGEIIHKWSAYSCIHAEIEENGEVYILSNGKWYKITKNFVHKINEEFNSLISNQPPIDLPECNGEKEDEYNKRVAEELGFCLMDRELIPYGGGFSKIEFCDLFSKDTKSIIHIKHYGGSSPLSHLFAQGLVSGELMKSDPDFIQEVKKKLRQQCTIDDLTADDYHIIFVIISQREKISNELNLPFFSKVTAKNAKRGLQSLGYKVSLVIVPNRKEV